MLAVREDVEALLKKYPEWKRKIALLEYEREHPAQESRIGVISGWALSHSIGGAPGAPGHISDKTMQIALNFQEEADRINYATIMEIDQELAVLRNHIERMDFYVSQIDPRQAEIIKGHYFEGKTWAQLQKELHISSRTLSGRCRAGLDALAAMGKYLEEVMKEPVRI